MSLRQKCVKSKRFNSNLGQEQFYVLIKALCPRIWQFSWCIWSDLKI